MEDPQVKRTVACAVLCVFALSLVSLAADNRAVSAKPRGGKAAHESKTPASVPIFRNLASSKNLYWCCNGYIVAGSGNIYGYPPYQEAIQFTTTTATKVHAFRTEVAYLIQGTATTFNMTLQSDAGGIPSGTVIAGPVEMSVDSQVFGGCCSSMTGTVKTTALPAGTYWAVWAADSGSDLVAEVNVADRDEVDAANLAFFDGTNWNPYQSTQSFAVTVK
jgi:hypothetical protein